MGKATEMDLVDKIYNILAEFAEDLFEENQLLIDPKTQRITVVFHEGERVDLSLLAVVLTERLRKL